MQAGASIIIKDGNLSCEPANLHVKTQSFNEHVKTSSADYLAQSSREIPLLEAAVFGGGAAGGLDPGLVYACEENLVESEVMRSDLPGLNSSEVSQPAHLRSRCTWYLLDF